MNKSSYTEPFSHMEEAFIIPPDRAHPRLPLAQYVTVTGLHKLSRDNMIFDEDARYIHHYHAKWEFPNGRSVSVISGQLFNCSPDKPYEVWVMGKKDDREPEPRPYQTDEDLMKILIQEMLK